MEKAEKNKKEYGANMEEIWARYGPDASEAWNSYKEAMDTGELLPVIGDRLSRMRPELVKTLYTFVLVFAQK